MMSNWRDVLAVYAVRTTTDASSPDEVATLTEEKLDILRQIFWDMNAISYWVETISGDKDESDTVILHITVTVKDHLQMAEEYRFNGRAAQAVGGTDAAGVSGTVRGGSPAATRTLQLESLRRLAKIMENLPADLSEAAQSKLC